MNAFEIRRLAGRCANGGELDSGTVYHAIEVGQGRGWVAYCGAKPGRASAGWSQDAGRGVVTCPRCARELERRQAPRPAPRPATLELDGYGGRSSTPVLVVGETPTRYRITPAGLATVRLAGRRRVLVPGGEALVPKTAVRLVGSENGK